MQVTESEIVDMKVAALKTRLDEGTISQDEADAELASIIGPMVDQVDAGEPTEAPDAVTYDTNRPSTVDRIVFAAWQAMDVFANAYFQGRK